MCAKVSDELSLLQFPNVNSIKRALQWILGCTYVKKSMKSKIAEMFQFNEAPHIIIYEKSDSDSWFSKIGIILGILIFVLIAYYLIESLVRSIRSFLKAALKEPQSTVSTPRRLSPNSSKTQLDPLKFDSPEKHNSADVRHSVTLVKQKIKMNEPVNCVFIRPQSSSSINVKSDTTQSSDNMSPTPKNKKSEKSEEKEDKSEKEIKEDRGKSGCEKLEFLEKESLELIHDKPTTCETNSYCDISSEIMNEIKKMLNAPNLTKTLTDDGNAEWSLRSMTSLSDDGNYSDVGSESLHIDGIGKETIADIDDVDIVIDDNHLFAEEENLCNGNILVKEPSKVLFRWTDENAASVDAVTITGSFFGWNMHLPMRRSSNDKTFVVCIELPPAMHSYQIQIYRFD